ncbi:MAG: C39 family peptidase [Candidatus Paceibacterota bacterium]
MVKKTIPAIFFLSIISILIFFVIGWSKFTENTLERNSVIESVQYAYLDVPAFKQQYLRSCEESALRMVLAFYGIQSNDMEIVKKVGYAPKPHDFKNNIWDDPNEMFVGSIDDKNKSGYGAFAPAIAKAATSFGRNAESYIGVSPQFLAEQIYNGYPVIVWGFYTPPPYIKYFWNTQDGKKINAYRGEHTRVVVGVYGKKTQPTGFLLNDPYTGSKDEYWSTERLMTQMNTFPDLTDQAVVVK